MGRRHRGPWLLKLVPIPLRDVHVQERPRGRMQPLVPNLWVLHVQAVQDLVGVTAAARGTPAWRGLGPNRPQDDGFAA